MCHDIRFILFIPFIFYGLQKPQLVKYGTNVCMDAIEATTSCVSDGPSLILWLLIRSRHCTVLNTYSIGPSTG